VRFESGTFTHQNGPIELPATKPRELLFERFILTDKLSEKGNKLKLKRVSGWVEITIGVIGARGSMKALSPSVTVAQASVLSVEEKFQGGTGINLTPPPALVMSPKIVKLVQKRIAAVANGLGLHGYSRIDAFVQRTTGELMIIEVNTLPALTPSTVLFHQGLAETPKLYPRALLEKIIDLGSLASPGRG
jgi:D-alanine-D-alanine ligase-like ATP-grasp enzyme